MNTLHDELMVIVKPSISLEDSFNHKLDTYLNSGVLDYITKFKISDTVLATQYNLLLRVSKEIDEFLPQYMEYLSSTDKIDHCKTRSLESLSVSVDNILSLSFSLDDTLSTSSNELRYGSLNANLSREIRYRNLKANRALSKDTYDKLLSLANKAEEVMMNNSKNEDILFLISELDNLSDILGYLNNSFMYMYKHLTTYIDNL